MWVNTRYLNSIRGRSSCERQGQLELTSMFDLESPSTGRMRLRTSSRLDPAYASPSLTDSKTPSVTEVLSLIAISLCATSHWTEGLPSGRYLNTASLHEGLTPRFEFSKTSVSAQFQLFNFSGPTSMYNLKNTTHNLLTKRNTTIFVWAFFLLKETCDLLNWLNDNVTDNTEVTLTDAGKRVWEISLSTANKSTQNLIEQQRNRRKKKGEKKKGAESPWPCEAWPRQGEGQNPMTTYPEMAPMRMMLLVWVT